MGPRRNSSPDRNEADRNEEAEHPEVNFENGINNGGIQGNNANPQPLHIQIDQNRDQNLDLNLRINIIANHQAFEEDEDELENGENDQEINENQQNGNGGEPEFVNPNEIIQVHVENEHPNNIMDDGNDLRDIGIQLFNPEPLARIIVRQGFDIIRNAQFLPPQDEPLNLFLPPPAPILRDLLGHRNENYNPRGQEENQIADLPDLEIVRDNGVVEIPEHLPNEPVGNIRQRRNLQQQIQEFGQGQDRDVNQNQLNNPGQNLNQQENQRDEQQQQPAQNDDREEDLQPNEPEQGNAVQENNQNEPEILNDELSTGDDNIERVPDDGNNFNQSNIRNTEGINSTLEHREINQEFGLINASPNNAAIETSERILNNVHNYFSHGIPHQTDNLDFKIKEKKPSSETSSKAIKSESSSMRKVPWLVSNPNPKLTTEESSYINDPLLSSVHPVSPLDRNPLLLVSPEIPSTSGNISSVITSQNNELQPETSHNQLVEVPVSDTISVKGETHKYTLLIAAANTPKPTRPPLSLNFRTSNQLGQKSHIDDPKPGPSHQVNPPQNNEVEPIQLRGRLIRFPSPNLDRSSTESSSSGSISIASNSESTESGFSEVTSRSIRSTSISSSSIEVIPEFTGSSSGVSGSVFFPASDSDNSESIQVISDPTSSNSDVPGSVASSSSTSNYPKSESSSRSRASTSTAEVSGSSRASSSIGPYMSSYSSGTERLESDDYSDDSAPPRRERRSNESSDSESDGPVAPRFYIPPTKKKRSS